MKILAIIPARKGSKGIPFKNRIDLGGKPLICWTIEAALQSCLIDRLVVSTDCPIIADIARVEGAEVPNLRPEHLSLDDTPSYDVVEYVLNDLKNRESYSPDAVMLLQPTSPFRSSEDIVACISMIQQSVESVVSVSPVRKHPLWMKTINSDGYLENVLQEQNKFTRRQDLPNVYLLNGAIYLTFVQSFFANKGWFSSKTIPYIMPENRSLDIDTPLDMAIAELILQQSVAVL